MISLDNSMKRIHINKTFDRLQPLTREEIRLIHTKTVDILKNTGMWFQSEKVRNIFEHHGFKVEGEIVYFDEKAVENALATTPAKFTLLARNPENNVELGGESFGFAPAGGAPFILDYNDGLRESTSKDYIASLKLTQTLDDIDINRELVASGGDIPPEDLLLYELLESIKYTDKPLDCSFGSGVGLLSILFGISKEKMRQNSLAGITYAIGNANTASPLGLAESQTDRMLELCQYGVALTITPVPMAGLTAPCTLPGLLISQNCEIIGTLVLSQLINPGCPVMYGCTGNITDMRFSTASIGAAEARIIEHASAQMAGFYELPTRGDVSLTDANSVDFQAGAESALNTVNAVRCGINFMPGLGAMGSWNIGSLEKLVLDTELVGYVKRLVRPLEFTEETMACNLIQKVRPKGTYIVEEHTFEHFKSEFHQPTVFSREPYDKWEKNGEKDAMEKAHEKVMDILDSYERPDLSASTESDLDKYAKAHYPTHMRNTSFCKQIRPKRQKV